MIPDSANPQYLNRYSYCLNNPLKYTDPTGHWGLSNAATALISITLGIAMPSSLAIASTIAIAPSIAVASTMATTGGQASVSDIGQSVATAVNYAAGITGWSSSPGGSSAEGPPAEGPPAEGPPNNVTINVHEAFTLVPPGYGTLRGSISGERSNGDISIYVRTLTHVVTHEPSSGFASAEVYVNGIKHPMDLAHPNYPYMVSVNTTFQEGSLTVSNVSPETPVSVVLGAGVWTNSVDYGGITYYLVVPTSWTYVLWGGRN
jgi:hypothetical protein